MQTSEYALQRIAGDIVIAFLQTQTLTPDEVCALLSRLQGVLAAGADIAIVPTGKGEVAARAPAAEPVVAAPTPPVAIEDSVHPDYLVSLEDGRRYKSLKRHLSAKFGLTPEAYREKWGLPDDYPMVAPNYAQRRSELAKSYEFGKAHRKDPAQLAVLNPKPARR